MGDPQPLHANPASNLSLVTINEGDGSGGVRLSDRGYSSVRFEEGQQIYDSSNKLNNMTILEGKEQSQNL